MTQAPADIIPEGSEDVVMTASTDDFLLHPGEKLYKIITPHYMAFYDMYLIWAAVIFFSVFFIFFGPHIAEMMGNPGAVISRGLLSYGDPSNTNKITNAIPMLPAFKSMVYSIAMPLNDAFEEYAQIPIWIGCLFALSMIVSVIKIEFKWSFLIPGTGIAALAIVLYNQWDARNAYLIAIGVSIIGMVLVELYRRAHKFYLTDSRVVTRVSFISHKRNELEYDKINNLVLNQDMVGRIFNFGVLIPATASGLGMGQDHAFMAIGAGGASPFGGVMGGGVIGGRSINTPRARSMYSLFGIPDPEKVQNLVSRLMREDNQAPLLREMTAILKEIRDNK